MSSKGLAKFGVSFRDMLKETLSNDKSGKINGTLEALSFEVFWKTIAVHEHGFQPVDQQEKSESRHFWSSDPQKAEQKALQQAQSELMNLLVSYISQISTMVKKRQQLVTGGGSSSDLNAAVDSISEDIQSLVNTSVFLALSYNYDEKSINPVLDVVRNLQKQHLNAGKPYLAIEEAIKMISKVFEPPNSENNSAGYTIDTLVRMISASLLTPEEISMNENVLEHSALETRGVIGGETMVLWKRLKDLVCQPDTCVKLNENISIALNSIWLNMRVLSKTFKISRELSGAQLKALLHMASSLLKSWTKSDQALASKLISACEEFYQWPRPNSDAAAEFLYLLRNEMRARGYVMIEKFLHESRIPQMKFFATTQQEEDFWAQPMFCMLDSTSAESARFFRLLKMRFLEIDTNLNPEMKGSSPNSLSKLCLVRGMSTYSQLHLIIQLFLTNLPDIPSEQMIKILTRLDQEKLADVFYTACVACHEGLTVELSDSESAVHVSKRLRELWNVIQSFLKPSPEYYLTPQSLLAPPVLPNTMCVPLMENLLVHGLNTKLAAPGGFASLPSSTYGAILQKLLIQHQLVSDAKDPAIVRLFLCGSDRLIHAALCGYLGICFTKPEILNGIEIEWYVIPLEDDCSLSAFIARNDAWYNRYIYQPFRTRNPLIPWIRIDPPPQLINEDTSSSQAQVCGASNFFKDLLESYAREATSSVDISINEVFGFADESPTAQIAIPFLCRVEFSARTMALGKRKYEGDSRSCEEMLKDKSTKIPLVVVNYYKNTIASGSQITNRDDPVDQVIIANVPIVRDKCFPVDPSNESDIQLYVKYNEFKRSKFCPQEIRCGVASLELSTSVKTERFYITVDNEPYGPYQRIVLLLEEEGRNKLKYGNDSSIAFDPSILPDGHSIDTISIKTFFPISL